MSSFVYLSFIISLVYHSSHEPFKNQNNLIEARVEKIKIDERSVSIYLPPNYKRNSSYKVIYFTDGQLLFGNKWRLENDLTKLVSQKRIEPIIVVGIHTDQNRNNDLIPFNDPWISANWGPYEPKAAQFSDYLNKRVIPYIEHHYSVQPGKENRAIGGVSLGGLYAMWEAIKNSQKWGMVIALSPSFWVNNFQIFEFFNRSKEFDSKVWFDIGATTGEWNYYVPLIETLTQKGLIYGEDIFYFEDPKGIHDQSSWSKRIANPLILFASDKEASIQSMNIEIEVIKSAQSNNFYQRLNPIITLNNGVMYSASSQAKYKLLNTDDGVLKKDGRFEFENNKDLQVEITYRNLKDTVLINFKFVQSLKKK